MRSRGFASVRETEISWSYARGERTHTTPMCTLCAMRIRWHAADARSQDGVRRGSDGVLVIKLQGGVTFDTVTWRGEDADYELSVEQGKIQSTQAGGAIY
jgi:hypothetical protein